MLNSKKITIGGRDVTVTEVRVRRVLQLLPMFEEKQQAVGHAATVEGGEIEQTAEDGFMTQLEILLQESCGLTIDNLQDLHSSELEQLWQAFYEVNSFFFRTAARFGLEEKVAVLLGTVLQGFGGLFAGFFAEAMEGVSTTDSPGLSPPLPTTNGNSGTNA